MPHTFRIYRSITPTAALLIGLTGMLVLTGWISGNEYFKRVFPDLVAMNPLTATAFVCAANALWLLTFETVTPAVRVPRLLLCLFVLLAGASKLADLSLGTHLNFDRLMFHSQLASGADLPNRMAPNTALCLTLSGLSLVLLDTGSTRLLASAQTVAVLVVLLSLLAVVGYAYDIASFYGVGTFIPMALHTGTSFLMLAAGLLFARPNGGIMSIVTSDTAGGVIARLLLPAAVLVPIAVGWLPFAGLRAGLFNLEIGVSLFVVANVLILMALIWWNATLLYRSDLRRQQVEAQLLHAASHDSLTGLANRARFLEELVRAAERARRTGAPVAVLYLDLDGFKQVNDTLGHPAGDELLRQVGKRLRSCARAVDLVARLGGDEFTVLSESASPASVIGLAERILRDVGQPYDCAGHRAEIGVSIGIALSRPDTRDSEELLQRADAALYSAKRGGKGRFKMS